MPNTSGITDWGAATWAAFAAGLVSFYSFVPNLIGAILILLVGWGVAALLYAVTDKVLEALHFDRLMDRTGLSDAIIRSGVKIDASNLLATLVKWSVLLVTFMVAADALRLTQVSMGIAALLSYIPNVLAAAIILGLGMLLANFVSRLVRGAAATTNIRMSEMLSELSYWVIVAFVVLGAIAQLNIAPALVQTLYTAVIAAVAGAAALAFGLGLRDQAQDVVAGRALLEQLHEGDRIAMDQIQGEVEMVGSVKTLIRSRDGSSVSVPNHLLIERVFSLNPSRMAPLGGGGGPAPEKPKIERPWRPEEGGME